MKQVFDTYIQAVFVLLTLALIYAGAGYAFGNLPIKYCVIYGILWQVHLFLMVFWEES